jgi:CubicO group peptidase (beta-lactamase class C family)
VVGLRPTTVEVNDSTLFMMASCSKPVTVLGIMKLYGQGKMGLDDAINDYSTEGGMYYFIEDNFADEKPGSNFSYYNMSYSLLGLLIEHLSGKSFSHYMQENIFPPLRMHNSYWFLREIAHYNIAHAHIILPEEEPQVLNHYGYPSFPDGQLRTTASDYAQVSESCSIPGIFLQKSFLKKIRF